MSWCRAHSRTCNQLLIPVWRLLSESYCLVSMGRPLWREYGSVAWSAITHWSESGSTRNHTLLSHLRLPQPERPGSRIYTPRNRVAQFYLRAFDCLYVASCKSQGYGGSILTRLYTGITLTKFEVTLRLTISQCVLASISIVGLATRYYFLSVCCCLKFAALFLWGVVFTNVFICM
jgi:hypothetical protein